MAGLCMWTRKQSIDSEPNFWWWREQFDAAGGPRCCRFEQTDRSPVAPSNGWAVPRRTPAPLNRDLCLEERLRLADLCLGGEGVRAIARVLGRSPGTAAAS